jgi:hypothetical protein
MVHAVREVTMMAAKEIDPESRTENSVLISQLLAVLIALTLWRHETGWSDITA